MSNNRLIVRLLAPLAVALFVVAITIGLTQPTLVETAQGNVVCASAFGTGDISGATEAGQASCAALTSERQMWSFSLLGVSLGLLFGLFWVALSTSNGTREDEPGPAPVAEWVDYPAVPSPDPTETAPAPTAPSPAGDPSEVTTPRDVPPASRP